MLRILLKLDTTNKDWREKSRIKAHLYFKLDEDWSKDLDVFSAKEAPPSYLYIFPPGGRRLRGRFEICKSGGGDIPRPFFKFKFPPRLRCSLLLATSSAPQHTPPPPNRKNKTKLQLKCHEAFWYFLVFWSGPFHFLLGGFAHFKSPPEFSVENRRGYLQALRLAG